MAFIQDNCLYLSKITACLMKMSGISPTSLTCYGVEFPWVQRED